jgi:hypothetical protein
LLEKVSCGEDMLCGVQLSGIFARTTGLSVSFYTAGMTALVLLLLRRLFSLRELSLAATSRVESS